MKKIKKQTVDDQVAKDKVENVPSSLLSNSNCSKLNTTVKNPQEAIAIVGMAFRFPGDLADEDSLWSALKEGRDLVTEVPADRWAVDELQHDKRNEPGRSVTFSAGVLSRIEEFDAEFFGISPREAALLDPQQRLLLELAWEAFENGGHLPSSLAGSDCAVYVGISSLDYGVRGQDDLANMTPHFMTGNTFSIAANRLSYVFDLRGPSLAVDTACSSSLVALHQACNTLRSGEASTALVGGVNLLLHPYPFIGFTKASMLSAQGRCKVFDASGDGYVRAEGGAVLLLKSLEKAMADGDEIHAVILASGVNSDGARKTGITIPSADGQAELMRSVLEKSGFSALDIDFIEAHGTGTAIGDPIETAAIGAVYGCGHESGRAQPLPIGSVKVNLGHLEAASGMAGLVKTVLALKNRALPPTLNLVTPNPHIDFEGLNIQPVTRYTKLAKEGDVPLIAGLNSFGFGGANAHVLVRGWNSQHERKHEQQREQQHKQQNKHESNQPSSTLPPLFLSARTTEGLRAVAQRYSDFLNTKLDSNFYDVAYAAAFNRERLEKRLALQATDSATAGTLLARYAEGEAPDQIIIEDGLPEVGGIAFVYSGNGAQWLGMGRELMSESKRFNEIVTQLDELMLPAAGFSVIAELNADESAARFDDTVVAQPLLFAIQFAVTTLLREQGVEAAAVTGHSVGEVAAAWAAGALDLNQAIRVICARSSAQGRTRGMGRMAAIALSESAMNDLLGEMGRNLDIEIAGVNGPGNVTISGNLADLEHIQKYLEPKGVFFRLLDLDYAFHSKKMDGIETPLLENLAGLAPSATGKTVFISTVTGTALQGEALNASYWWRNVREPVRLDLAMAKLVDLGCRVFLEISPHAILQRYMNECITEKGISARVLPTLRRNDDRLNRIIEAALRSHLLTDRPQLDGYFPESGQRIRLPNYPWQRERHWYAHAGENLPIIERRRQHPLLGWRLQTTDAAWENTIDPTIVPWLLDHQVGGISVFPGSAYVEMALAAAREWLGGKQFILEELDIISPLIFDGEHANTLRLELNPRDGSFQIKSRQRLSANAWTLHVSGRVLETVEHPTTSTQTTASIESAQNPTQTIDKISHYQTAAAMGLDYGPTFQGLSLAHIEGNRLEGVLDISPALQVDDYLLHPAVLDVCFQSLLGFFRTDIQEGQATAFLPVKMGRIDLYQRAVATHFRTHLRWRGTRSVLADIELLDVAGNLIARVVGLRARAAPLVARKQVPISNWRMVPRLQPHPVDERVSEMPSSRTLVDQLHASQNDSTNQRHSWFKEILPLFEALTLSFAYEAFQKLTQTGSDSLQRLQKSSLYAGWLASLLRKEDLLIQQNPEQNGQWHLVADANLPPAMEIWQTLLCDAPACFPQLSLMGRIGQRLPELLSGEVDPCQFLNSLQRSFAAQTLHDNDPAYLGTRGSIENTLHYLASIWPEHRTLRVLEIAAGPSEMPRKCIGALPEDRLNYVLALADEETVHLQQVEYQEFANVTVTSLNYSDWKLTADTSSTGMFDVVILRHVLHRATSPHVALKQTRRWLASGGIVLLAERHADWNANFVAGLDPTWWHADTSENGGENGRENGIQAQSSLLAPEVWQQVLRDEGFGEIEYSAERASEGFSQGAYLLIAKRPVADLVSLPTPQPASWLLLVDDASSVIANHVRIQLESQGQSVTVSGSTPEIANAKVDHIVNLIGWSRGSEEATDVLADLLYRVQIMATHVEKPPRLWLITRGGALTSDLPTSCTQNPLQAALWGFGRVVMNEYPALRCTLIDLDCDLIAPDTLVRLVNELLNSEFLNSTHLNPEHSNPELVSQDGLNEIILSTKGRYSLVMHEESPISDVVCASESMRYRLDFSVPGQLRNLIWLPESERLLRDDEIEVRTHATGLNFRDVMYLMGLLPDEAVESGFAGASLGLEFSGVVTRIGARVRDLQPGNAVMGFGSSCFASHVVTRSDAVMAIPDGWTFEAAATVPTVFFTVYYALKHLANLQPGERVLIHGAAGGVGIAAVQIARHLGAEIFATAGSEEKRDFVRLLGADHVFDSRSLACFDEILAVTSGEGVDVVLNSLAGEAIRRNLNVLKPFGRFLELGKRDFFENTPIGLRPFKDNISYFGIDVDQLLTARPALASRLLRDIMALIREGVITPLPHRCFSADRVIDAFRFMQQSRHIGKVVVSLVDSRPLINTPAKAETAIGFDHMSTWMITGGLSGFGLESARWLTSRGVRNLVLLSRRGKETPDAKEFIEEMTKRGVNVLVLACDVADASMLGNAIERVQKTMPPLKGILHAAAIYDDRMIDKLDGASIDSVLRPKLLGAWNLHKLTLDIPLDHFVLYSSITTALGNLGQANYVAANSGLEGLTELRRSMGLPAICIGWGPISDAGYLARNEAVKNSLSQRLGKAPMLVAEALARLDWVFAENQGVCAVANFDWAALSRLLPSAQCTRFSELNRNLKEGGLPESDVDFRSLLAGKTADEVTHLVYELVTQEIAQILCIGVHRIEPKSSLHDLGMDSLMAVELALGLEKRFGVQLPVMMLNESPTAERVTARIVEKLVGGIENQSANQSASATHALIEHISRQNDEVMSQEMVESIAEDMQNLAKKDVRLIA